MTADSAYLDEIVAILVDCALFDSFSPNELRRTARYFNMSELAEGETIFTEGDVGTFMAVIHTGKVAVTKLDSADSEIPVATLSRGKVFGEMAVLDGERRSATCRANSRCRLATLSKDSLDRMLDDYPRIAARVIRAISVSLSRRLRMADFKLADHQL